MRAKVALGEPRAIGEQLKVLLLVGQDPASAHHIQAGFATEVGDWHLAVRPFLHVVHYCQRPGAGAVVDDPRSGLRFHEKGPERLEHEERASDVGFVGLLHPVGQAGAFREVADCGIVDKRVESEFAVSNDVRRGITRDGRTSRTCSPRLWRAS